MIALFAHASMVHLILFKLVDLHAFLHKDFRFVTSFFLPSAFCM
ncbi:hypothetical protein GLYMA_14G167701v4 [Glycine max]|nr:hypothetical protein GLYMA_14G167701v4 [Glycine max]KAH1094943.1 hypothetical protein GYH30_040298 [Glycine max]